jgi:hypothetical protein
MFLLSLGSVLLGVLFSCFIWDVEGVCERARLNLSFKLQAEKLNEFYVDWVTECGEIGGLFKDG